MGDGEGKFGDSCPGANVFSATIDDIDPTICPSYKNVVIMVGTNNLKFKNLSESKIRDLYKLYKFKIEQIRSLCKKSNIFICPVLSTRSFHINEQINIFNDYLFFDLAQTSLGVVFVEGFRQAFLNHNTRCLREDLSSDELHLDKREGVRRLVKLIKKTVFSVKRQGGNVNERVSSATYANKLRGGPVRPV